MDPDGTEHIIAVSDPDFAPEPVSRAATAGASTVSIDELARTKAQAQGANVWNRQVDPKGLDQPPATRPAQKFDLSEKDPNWASGGRGVKKVAPRPLKTKTGTCTFCGAAGVVLRGDDNPRCLECFKSDNTARARMAEFGTVPTPVYDPFHRNRRTAGMKNLGPTTPGVERLGGRVRVGTGGRSGPVRSRPGPGEHPRGECEGGIEGPLAPCRP